MIYSFGDVEVDVARVEVRRNAVAIATEPQVFDLLVHLIEHRERVVPKEELLDRVWGDRFVGESTLTSRIAAVRQAVGDDGRNQNVIRTTHGRGYRFVAEIDLAGSATSDASLTSATATRGSDALIGRERDLAALADHLANSRLVTLTGPGGVGKTSLANSLRENVATADYPDGTWFVALVSATPGALTNAVATVLDVQPRLGQNLEQSLIEVLAPRRAMLVLDNCEHVIDAASDLVSKLLSSCPELQIVATSRESLQIRGEQVYPVPPLEIRGSLDQKQPSAALRLFCKRAESVDPAFALDETNAELLEEICSRLDGIPLAIELAAARTRALDVNEVAARLDERFRLLKSSRRGGDPRHRTLADTIGWSYDLLEPAEQQLFCQLSVFSGPFDVAAAEAICVVEEDVIDLIMSLVDRSMLTLRRSGTTTRYEVLDSLRAFGSERLDDAAGAALYGRHRDHYVDFTRGARAGLDSTDEFRWSTEIDRCFANLHVVHLRAVESGDHNVAMTIVTNVREYAMRSMRYEVMSWASESVGVANPTDPLYATTLAIAAYGAFVRGEYDKAVELAEQARSIEADTRMAPSGMVERVLANCHSLASRSGPIITECRRQVEAAETSGEPALLAHAEYMYSAALTSLGQEDEAYAAAGRSRSAADMSGSATAAAAAEFAAAFALTRRDRTRGLLTLEKCDELSRSVANRWMSAFARNEIASLRLEAGETDSACALFADLLDVWHRSGDWSQLWLTLRQSIVALDQIDQHAQAATVIGAVEAHATMGAAPSSPAERERRSEAVARVAAVLGSAEYQRLVAEGAGSSVGAVVQQTRRALTP